ncbi:MAG TPA: hypothetical protein PKC43_09965 [Phycisphaerales bacterium]|nr:hypothetical protein [Phycisphaerales bacterium]HMP37760.1 hypothetical protein [Phycisphaerales bacterium]
MSQFGTPARRIGGEIDVYTALLGVAALVLLAGVVLMAMRNIDHSRGSDAESGGVFTLVG